MGLLTLLFFLVVLVFIFDMKHFLEESLHFGGRGFEGFGGFAEMSTNAVAGWIARHDCGGGARHGWDVHSLWTWGVGRVNRSDWVSALSQIRENRCSPLGKGNAWSETDFDPWKAVVPFVSGPLEPAEAAMD